MWSQCFQEETTLLFKQTASVGLLSEMAPRRKRRGMGDGVTGVASVLNCP